MNHLSIHNGMGDWVAFLFGAIFNLIVSISYASHLDYAIHMLIGGLIWLLFKKLGDYLSRKPKARLKETRKDTVSARRKG